MLTTIGSIVLAGLFFWVLVIVPLISYMRYRINKRRKKEKAKKESTPSPSEILVDLVGSIVLRECMLVSSTVRPNHYRDNTLYNYTFSKGAISAEACDIDTYFSTTASLKINGQEITLIQSEQNKLKKYLKDACELKNDMIKSEKEKNRQIAACNAIESLMLESPDISTTLLSAEKDCEKN